MRRTRDEDQEVTEKDGASNEVKSTPKSKTKKDSESASPGPVEKRAKKASSAVSEVEKPPEAESSKEGSEQKLEAASAKPAKPKPARSVLERAPTPRAEHPPPGRRFLAISWNIVTIRSLVNKQPGVLTKFMETYNPDVICLQEHKLQEKDVAPIEAELAKLLPHYTPHWTCSLEKKGYSGIVVLVRKGVGGTGAPAQATLDAFLKKSPKVESKQAPSETSIVPEKVTKGMGVQEHDQEGRLITLEYPAFFMVFTYVPNAGEGLKRLDYRVEKWDMALKSYLKELEAKKPVLLGGDLNVAHLDRDIWNVEAKHISKSAGTSPQERASFGTLLESGFVDTFRHFHPEAEHCYSYWSVRAGNRSINRGLRLDYFLASSCLLPSAPAPAPSVLHVHDAWLLDQDTPDYGDHCPVAVLLSLPQ